ncbi:O-antigen ligase family protein [Herbiconiux sp. YIM B11900]|uniref:O-antigen ligase family protein n=1 Tax=Herbiconiux sp. YIM B11900 TaxID=3404131 RepID=UPI003F8610A7
MTVRTRNLRFARKTPLASAAIVLSVLSTVVFLPGALDMWQLPKVGMVFAGCFAAALVAPTGVLPRWFVVLVACAGGVLLVCALAGSAPVPQVMGRWPRYEGVVSISAYFAACWLGSRLLGPRSADRHSRLFIYVVAFCSIMLGLIAGLETAGVRLVSGTVDRTGSLTGNASAQGVLAAMFSAVLVPALLGRWGGGRPRRIVLAAAAACAVGAVVLSASRGAILALFAIALIGITVAATRHPRRIRAMVAGGCCLVLLAGICLIVPLTRDRFLGLTPFSGATISGRIALWSETARLVAERPVLGVGPSGFEDAIAAAHDDSWFALAGDAAVDSPHNWILQAAVVGGVPLVLLVVGLACAVAVTAFRAWRRLVVAEASTARLGGASLAVVACGLAMLADRSSPATCLFAALLLGSLVAVPRVSLPTAVAPRRFRGVVIPATLASALLLLVVSASAAEIALAIGTSDVASSRFDEAERAFERAESLRPWDVDVDLIAAESFAASAERPGSPVIAAQLAASWADRALAAAPDSIAAAKALAVGQQYTGDLPSAVSTLRAAAARAPGDPDVAHRLGGLLTLGNEWEDARIQLERAVRLDPDGVGRWQTLAYLCSLQGDTECEKRSAEQISWLGG